MRPSASQVEEHTVDTRAVEHLTGFTGWASPIALDLGGRQQAAKDLEAVYTGIGTTFRLRQLLQFIASLGS